MRRTELAEIRARHTKSPGAPEGREHVCLTCWQPWPCDTWRLLEDRERDGRLGQTARFLVGFVAGMLVAVTLFFGVAKVNGASGQASWYDDGSGFYGAVHSYTFGDPRYAVSVCRADNAKVCTIVVVRDHMRNTKRMIDLSPDAFAALWPKLDRRTALYGRGVVDVTLKRVPLPATSMERSCPLIP